MRKDIGQTIRKARESQRLTLRQLADKVGITDAALCYIENGRTTKISIQTAELIAQTLECDFNQLFGIKRYKKIAL